MPEGAGRPAGSGIGRPRSGVQRQGQFKPSPKQQERMAICAELYKKGWSIRKMRDEIMRRLDLKSLSTETVFNDVQALLEEWRTWRIKNTNAYVQLELERIDDTIRELWEQWEKSKTNYNQTTNKQKGGPKKGAQKAGAVGAPRIGFNTAQQPTADNGAQPTQPPATNESGQIETYAVEKMVKEVIALGDVSYIAEIRQQLAERRKLLGLYAPDKKEMIGNVGFAAFLMKSGKLDEATQPAAQPPQLLPDESNQ